MKETTENFFFTDYRSATVRVGTVLLALTMMMVGLIPEMFHVGSSMAAGGCVASGLVLAGLVLWASQRLLCQDRAFDLQQRKVVEVTCFAKWFNWRRVRVLAEFDDITTVYVNPKIDLWSHYHTWIYPIMLLTSEGRSITVSNYVGAQDRDGFSIPKARLIAEMLGCDMYDPGEHTPVEVVRQGEKFSFQPTSQSVGWVGGVLVVSLIVGLVWVLLSLMP